MNADKIYDVEKIITHGYGKTALELAKEIDILYQEQSLQHFLDTPINKYSWDQNIFKWANENKDKRQN